MSSNFRQKVDNVRGPDGSPLSPADLPPTNTKRWVAKRKAQVVAAVRGGIITIEEACQRYSLSFDEFLIWQKNFDQHGLKGLRSTKVQRYRSTAKSKPEMH